MRCFQMQGHVGVEVPKGRIDLSESGSAVHG
jgi:hypothetical protein